MLLPLSAPARLSGGRPKLLSSHARITVSLAVRSVVSKESWLATTARIYNTYGVSGLYLGLTPRLLLCSVGGAFYFLASEAVKGFYAAQMGGGPV